ncbi:MAG: endolytic transglycosylase MltG [Gammaproteobacteria bacterium]|nr:endolytic transglycosylase MltG [Gammaproteobacteria bacterium]
MAVILMWHFAREIRLTLDRPIPLSEAVLFEIKSGQSITKIAREFASRRWLSHAIYLRIEATRLGLATRIQAGTYEVLPNSTVRELLRKFVAGEVKHYSVTLVEGIQFRTLRSQLAKLPGIVTTIGGLTDDEIMLKLSAPGESPEGRFFPSTYFYIHRSLDTDLLTRAYSKLQTVLNDQWTTRADDLPYSTPYEALIMASIIEKETGLAAERSQIAGVFIRRLQQNMLLQTDPTVIYGLGERFEGNVRRVDLATDTPYNSYIRPGLPPTPIAMPGEAAIRAALHPAPGSDLYFVARGDGSHEFSATLTAHNAAVRRFQLEQRKHEAR